MANAWNIKIIQLADGTVAFQPNLPDAQPGQPLGVNTGDTVTWNNTTDKKLTLQSIPPGTFLCNPIEAGSASGPIFNVTPSPGWTLVYSCVDPPQQQHSIAVVP